MAKYQCDMEASCTYHLPTTLYHLLAAQREPYKTKTKQKNLPLNEKRLRIFWGKVRRISRQQTNDMIERTQGLGRKSREETGKGNQMTTTLRFQTGRCHQASLRGKQIADAEHVMKYACYIHISPREHCYLTENIHVNKNKES